MRVHSLAFVAILSSALISVAEEPAGSRPATPTPNWTSPTEAGVGWDSGEYAYDGSGNIVRIGDDLFAYDGANRLRESVVHSFTVATSQAFKYDRYGNMTEIRTSRGHGLDWDPPHTAALNVDAQTNRLIDACNVPPCPPWSYDGAGNQIALGTELTYRWDAAGTMTELTGSVAHERYVYDANDERVVMVSLDGDREVVRRWTWRDGSNKVAREAVEYADTGDWTDARDYVYRGGTLLASFESSSLTAGEKEYHHHTDHLGTPRLITDGDRRKVAINVYTPFGVRASGGETPYVGFQERMRFTGHERDGEGSPYRPTLDYMHARYYTPEWGRFLSVDPTWESADLGRPQSWNRYAYVLNNPTLKVDPDGRAGIVGWLKQTGKDIIHYDAVRKATTGWSHATTTEKAMIVAIVGIAALDVGANFLAPEKAAAAEGAKAGVKGGVALIGRAIDGYADDAFKNGWKYLDVPKEVLAATKDFWKDINKPYLKNLLKEGYTIMSKTDPSTLKGMFKKEIKYLDQFGKWFKDADTGYWVFKRTGS